MVVVEEGEGSRVALMCGLGEGAGTGKVWWLARLGTWVGNFVATLIVLF